MRKKKQSPVQDFLRVLQIGKTGHSFAWKYLHQLWPFCT